MAKYPAHFIPAILPKLDSTGLLLYHVFWYFFNVLLSHIKSFLVSVWVGRSSKFDNLTSYDMILLQKIICPHFKLRINPFRITFQVVMYSENRYFTCPPPPNLAPTLEVKGRCGDGKQVFLLTLYQPTSNYFFVRCRTRHLKENPLKVLA